VLQHGQREAAEGRCEPEQVGQQVRMEELARADERPRGGRDEADDADGERALAQRVEAGGGV